MHHCRYVTLLSCSGGIPFVFCSSALPGNLPYLHLRETNVHYARDMIKQKRCLAHLAIVVTQMVRFSRCNRVSCGGHAIVPKCRCLVIDNCLETVCAIPELGEEGNSINTSYFHRRIGKKYLPSSACISELVIRPPPPTSSTSPRRACDRRGPRCPPSSSLPSRLAGTSS